MAEPVRNLPLSQEPDEDDSGSPVLLRWIEHTDGRREQLVMPLTPELFLEPQLEDKILQREPHGLVRGELYDLLRRHFAPDSLVLEDVQHDFGVPGLPPTGPDLSVTLGARPGQRTSFVVREEGVRPDLILEILSPDSARIRKVDEEDKPWIYGRAGIPEYLIVDLPRNANQHRFRLTGYRLDRRGHYRLIKPDPQGRLLSEATGLWFTVSPEGDRVFVFDQKTGERLLYSEELEAQIQAEVEARKTAEERAEREAGARRDAEERVRREAEARRDAEERVERLQEELNRLKNRLEP
ncbi:MAG TPA: Uma2 family endonuclease [Thermoanaerobaculia bacterium]|nr:Uma2 family endonuclease [Thermoanaerobaculia bacterium]